MYIQYISVLYFLFKSCLLFVKQIRIFELTKNNGYVNA